MYNRISNNLENGLFYASESEQNKRLEDDLIELNEWNENKSDLIEKTGLERLISPIEQTLANLETHFNTKLSCVSLNINSDANEFVKKQPQSNRLQWSLAIKKWKTSVDNPIYRQIKNTGIIDIMKYVNNETNNVNFAILDIFGYQFSPRYAKFKKIFDGLFEVVLEDEQLIIRLKKRFNFKLIIQEWECIQHIICSLSRKKTVQSTVIKKLSNSKRNNKTLAALREYDRIIKCIYILNYVDNKMLRQFVQQALNRGEAYHQLRRAIASVNGNQFRGGDDYQIDQWNDCARLIANCVIYYNSALLSGLVDKLEKENNQKAIDIVANLSPVAWRHILLGGNYSFEDKAAITNLNSLLDDVDLLSDDE